MTTFFREVLGAARLDGATYDEIDADPGRDFGAVLVVVVASIAAGIGAGSRTVGDILGVTVAALMGWMVWVFLTYIIGTRLLPGSATNPSIGVILRATGFSAAPGVLRVFGILPGVGWPIFMCVTVWMLAAFVVAIRHALNYSTASRALAVCALGWLISAIMFFAFVRAAI